MEQQFKKAQENIKSAKESNKKLLDELLGIQKEVKTMGATPVHEKRLKEIAANITKGIKGINIENIYG